MNDLFRFPLSGRFDGSVLIDEAAIVLADAIIRERGTSRSGDHASRTHDGQEEIGRMQPRPQRPIRRAIVPPSSGRNLTLGFEFACDLRWDQVDFAQAVLHVRRAKNGTPSTHPTGP